MITGLQTWLGPRPEITWAIQKKVRDPFDYLQSIGISSLYKKR